MTQIKDIIEGPYEVTGRLTDVWIKAQPSTTNPHPRPILQGFGSITRATAEYLVECANNGYGIWHDPSEKPSAPLLPLLLAILLPDTGNGWSEQGTMDNDGNWVLDEDLNGSHPLMPDKFTVVAWCYVPSWPEGISREGDPDPSEPILLINGDVLDPVTREVVNRLPVGLGFDDLEHVRRRTDS